MGDATLLLSGNKHKFFVYDIDKSKCQPLGLNLRELVSCAFVFVCVPTPMKEDGVCETGIVESVVNDLVGEGIDPQRIIIRSTVPVGTCRKLGTMFLPEFLTEQNWEEDFLNQRHWILGTNTRVDKTRDELYSLFESAYFEGTLKNRPQMTFATTEEAELAKYVRNCYLAVKVSFFNEIEEFCTKNSISYRKLRELTCMDERIRKSHTSVPGPDGKRGFGGTCFPKDISSLEQQMIACGMESYIIEGAKSRNIQIDRPEKDWQNNKGRAVT